VILGLDITVRAIVRRVAQARRVDERHIYSRRQDGGISEARNIVYWLIREVSGLSAPIAGRMLDRDHSTVLTQAKRIEEKRQGDLAFAAELEGYKRDLLRLSKEQLEGHLADPDPIAAARAVVNARDPIAAGFRISAFDLAAMAQRVVMLDEIAEATVQLLDRIDRAQAMRSAAAALYNAETCELIDDLVGALQALGYATANEEPPKQEALNAGSKANAGAG